MGYNCKCLDGVDYQVVPRFFLLSSNRSALFLLAAVFIRGRRLLIIFLPSAAFNRMNTVLSAFIHTQKALVEL